MTILNKTTILRVIVFIMSISMSFSQSNSDILETENWGKEIFTFPLRFAKDIKFKGLEEARFPKGWIKEEHLEFWSYAFAWKIDLKTKLTASQLEDYMKKYYDGLMVSVNKEKDLVLPKTTAKFQKNENAVFTGKVTTHDAFVTKKLLTLNIQISQQFCGNNEKSIVLFLVSPKEFDSKIWSTLKKIKIRNTSCN